MKRKIISLGVALSLGLLSSCGGLGTAGTAQNDNAQFGGGDLLGALVGGMIGGGQASGVPAAGAASAGSTGSLLGNIISTFAGGILTNQSSLVGTWVYNQPCVQFESSNLLAKAGGAVAANTVEQKLATYYKMVGIAPGTFAFAFDKNGTFQYAIGQKVMQGKYTFDSANKVVNLVSQTGMKVNAYVSITGNQMGLTFDATKLLSLITSISAQSSQLSTISALAGSFNGMKLGFEFVKSN